MTVSDLQDIFNAIDDSEAIVYINGSIKAQCVTVTKTYETLEDGSISEAAMVNIE